MTSRNPHSDHSRPGPSFNRNMSDGDRTLKMRSLFDGRQRIDKPRPEPHIDDLLTSKHDQRAPFVKKTEEIEIEKKKEVNPPPPMKIPVEVKKEMREEKKEMNMNVGVKVDEIEKKLKEAKKEDWKKELKKEVQKDVKPEEKRRSSSKGNTKHPNELGGCYLRLYKVMYDSAYMSHLNTKDFVRRYNGKCGDKYKQLDFPQLPSDPRSRYRKVDQPKNLKVPNFTVDDQYMGIPPKREVTISNLNDNVNAEFLKKMARNHKLEPQDVIVFHHPETRKHLGMALILFLKSKDARAFMESCNGTSVMGLAITCILDPFAAQLAAKFTEITKLPLEPLSYLNGMSEHELSLRREKITGGTAAPTAAVDGAAPPAAVVMDEERDRSLSPMDMDNSPQFDAAPPPPPIDQPFSQQAQQAHYDDAGASYKMEPPPPYSELPPSNHGVYEERRSDGRRRSVEEEEKPRRDKRRRPSTSSSSSNSSGEGQGSSSRRRSDGGVKKKREEYLKVKRYVSSERDSNGDKRILKEVKTVTYKRRTEQRTTIADQTMKKESPDSFDEEMKRRERSMSKGKRSGGRDGMGWSSPSSDSDNGRGRGRKRAKDQAESSQEERRTQPPADPTPSTPATPSRSTCAATPSTTSSRSSRFHSAPIFDPSQPPPIVVPPVGLVLPTATSLPPPPPQHLPPPTINLLPPPPLPGGFIPPPEFFGIQSNAAMMNAASAIFAGLPPLPPGLPPPPPMMAPMMGGMTPMMGGMTPMPYGAVTPAPPNYATPVKTPKPVTPYKSTSHLDDSALSLSASVSSPSMTSSARLARASSSSSLTTTSGRTPTMAEKAVATPGTPSDGGSTPLAASAASAAAAAEKKEKANLDDRLSQLFGLKKKKEEEAKEMKHAASAPSISTMAAVEQKQREDDDMDIDDDDDMDVASSSSEPMMEVKMERSEEMGETKEGEEERKRNIKRLEAEAERLTEVTIGKLLAELQQQLTKDLQRKCESTAYAVISEWERKQKNEGEEKKKQMIRDNLAAANAREKESPKKDPMEEMLAKKLLSPEGLHCGISKMFSNYNIIKKKNLVVDISRDGTPMSRDSRAPSREKSRSSSRSSSSGSDSEDFKRRREESSQSGEESTAESEEDEEEVSRAKEVKRRPNMRNFESSQSRSGSDGSEDESDTEDKENESALDDVDVTAMSDDEADTIKEEIESTSSSGPSTPLAASSAVVEKEVKKEEEEDSQQVPFVDHRPLHPLLPPKGFRSLSAPRPNAAAAGAMPPPLPGPIPMLKPVKKKIQGQKVPHALLGLLPCDVPKTGKKEKKLAIPKMPKCAGPPLSEKEWIRARDSFMAGMDGEDEKYLQMALEEMQLKESRPFGVKEVVPFESHLRAYTPLEVPKPLKVGRVDCYFMEADQNGKWNSVTDLAGIVPHPTGCARAQGFYRLTQKQKIRIMRRPEAFQDRTEINERDEVVTRHQVQAQKEQRSMNRRLQTMVDSNPNSEFFKVNQLKYRKKMIKFARSRIHGWGLYALEPIAPDDMIVEYIGQKIRPIIADEREKQYERRGIGSSYLFRIDEDEVIDATRQGNFARFINHSCQPNCYAKVVTVDGDKRIVIYSKSLIQKGDEITYDYKFPLEDEKIVCLCGAPSCRGSLN